MISTKSRPQIYSTNKPCCKVCQDAGKPENIYLSHYVKDLSGNVTCPTLLSQECRYCHKKGHTTSHCSILKKQKEVEENMKKPPLSPVKKTQKTEKKANVFAYLDMTSDDEDETEKVVEFPKLAAQEAKDLFEKLKYEPQKVSYASMAAKTVADYKVEQVKETKVTPYVDKKLEITIQKATPKPTQKKSWVEMCEESDSEGDDEEFDEENSAW